MTALLSCREPRFLDRQIELGTFEARGPLLVLVGAWRPFFELVSGQTRLSGGAVEIQGVGAEAALADGKIGLCSSETSFPASWSAEQLLSESARLLGQSRRAALSSALDVAAELEIGDLLAKRWSASTPAQRRAIAIAVGVVGRPLALVVEDPFEGLEPSAQAYVARVLERALGARPVLLSVPSLPQSPEGGALCRAANELLLLGPAGLVVRGSHAELLAAARAYRIITLTSARPLLSRLSEAGYEVRPVTPADETALTVVDSARRGTRPLFEAALATGVAIVELWPLWDAGPHEPNGAEGV